jgi:hypothetical protein
MHPLMQILPVVDGCYTAPIGLFASGQMSAYDNLPKKNFVCHDEIRKVHNFLKFKSAGVLAILTNKLDRKTTPNYINVALFGIGHMTVYMYVQRTLKNKYLETPCFQN